MKLYLKHYVSCHCTHQLKDNLYNIHNTKRWILMCHKEYPLNTLFFTLYWSFKGSITTKTFFSGIISRIPDFNIDFFLLFVVGQKWLSYRCFCKQMANFVLLRSGITTHVKEVKFCFSLPIEPNKNILTRKV